MELECKIHGLTKFVKRTDNRMRCLKCASEAVSRNRRKKRETLVQEAGGACKLCGYSRYIGALQFHHVDPTTKLFGLSAEKQTASLAKLREEAAKCVLLCANCHAEVEAGIAQLS